MNKRDIYYLFSPSLRRIIRRLYFLPADTFDYIFGKRDALIPPKGKIFIGSGDFKEQGEKILGQLVKYGELKSNDRVLDVGCGIGRLAIPLTKYLNNTGSYEGFDIVKSGIVWCQKHISKSFPNFNFIHIDLKNDLYNLSTDKSPKDFIFPYKDENFDFVFLISVFTHMMPEDVEGYLTQIYRTLRVGGVCFATFFIINSESKDYMEKFHGLKFPYAYENYYLHNKNVKEANIAYDEDYLKNKLILKKGFEIANIYYGFWSGRPRENSIDFQDIVILRKKGM